MGLCRTDAQAEAPILWPPDTECQLIGKDLDVGKDWRQEEKEWQRTRCLDVITDSMDKSLSKLQEMEKPGVPQFMGLQRVRHDWETEQQ